MRRTLTIHPDSSLSYYGYYLCGFEQALGRVTLRFRLGDVPALLGPRDGLALITDDGKRIFIAADDAPTINPEALEWCDVYGKVNLDRSSDELSRSPKLTPIGPGFGIRWKSLGHDALYLARAGAAGGNAFARPPSRFKAAVKHRRDRVPLHLYSASVSDPDELFFIATHWSKHANANPPRQNFVRAVRGMEGLRFQGGLVGDPDPDTAAHRRYSMSEYLDRTGRSVAAFNTPAVHGCLGWKLGEFLALGKAIVTLPIDRELPEPLVDGVHVHVVDGSPESIVDAIARLRRDHAYRLALEKEAAAYYQRWLHPAVVARKLLASGSRP